MAIHLTLLLLKTEKLKHEPMTFRNPKEIPNMTVGKYAGMRIDTLPNGYLRWMLSKDFPEEFLAIAREKLAASDHNDFDVEVTRHALDMFSKRFLHLWKRQIQDFGDDGDGIATFVAKMAQRAWEEGQAGRKPRHSGDGISKELEGVEFIFGINANYPEYKTVITVLPVQ